MDADFCSVFGLHRAEDKHHGITVQQFMADLIEQSLMISLYKCKFV